MTFKIALWLYRVQHILYTWTQLPMLFIQWILWKKILLNTREAQLPQVDNIFSTLKYQLIWFDRISLYIPFWASWHIGYPWCRVLHTGWDHTCFAMEIADRIRMKFMKITESWMSLIVSREDTVGWQLFSWGEVHLKVWSGGGTEASCHPSHPNTQFRITILIPTLPHCKFEIDTGNVWPPLEIILTPTLLLWIHFCSTPTPFSFKWNCPKGMGLSSNLI